MINYGLIGATILLYENKICHQGPYNNINRWLIVLILASFFFNLYQGETKKNTTTSRPKIDCSCRHKSIIPSKTRKDYMKKKYIYIYIYKKDKVGSPLLGWSINHPISYPNDMLKVNLKRNKTTP